MAFVEPVTLALRGVQLAPLSLAHEGGLRAAAADGELWHLRVTGVPTPEETRGYIETALKPCAPRAAASPLPCWTNVSGARAGQHQLSRHRCRP